MVHGEEMDIWRDRDLTLAALGLPGANHPPLQYKGRDVQQRGSVSY